MSCAYFPRSCQVLGATRHVDKSNSSMLCGLKTVSNAHHGKSMCLRRMRSRLSGPHLSLRHERGNGAASTGRVMQKDRVGGQFTKLSFVDCTTPQVYI